MRVGTIHGIVTAAHVVEALGKISRIGLVHYLPTDKQGMDLMMSHVTNISIGRPPWNERGPDIAFMILPPDKVSTLEAKGCAFLDLESRREKILEHQYDKRGFYCCTGALGEETASTNKPSGRLEVAGKALFEIVDPGPIHWSSQCDYVICKPTTNTSYTPPASYGGMSGGGLFLAHIPFYRASS